MALTTDILLLLRYVVALRVAKHKSANPRPFITLAIRTRVRRTVL